MTGATTFKHGHAQTRKRHAQTCTDTRFQKRNDMHRHAQQPFFPCNRPLASLRLKLRKTKKPSNLSCQIHVTTCETSEKQCATKHDKQNINNDSAHANMVNDNMHIHTCVQPTAGLFSSPRAFALMGQRFDTMAFKATRCKRRCQIFDFVIPKDDVRDFAIPKDDVVRHRHSKIPGRPRRRLSILHFHLDTWSKSNLPMSAHLRWLTEAAPDHLLTTAKASASSDRSPPSPTNASTAGPLHCGAKPSPELQHQTKIHKLHKPTDIKHKIHKSTKQNPQNNPQ